MQLPNQRLVQDLIQRPLLLQLPPLLHRVPLHQRQLCGEYASSLSTLRGLPV